MDQITLPTKTPQDHFNDWQVAQGKTPIEEMTPEWRPAYEAYLAYMFTPEPVALGNRFDMYWAALDGAKMERGDAAWQAEYEKWINAHLVVERKGARR